MKYSKQRNLVLDFVKSVTIHPTAEDVYINVKKQKDNISLGTVYRNLDVLVKNGDLTRIQVGNSKDRFDGCTIHHYHAVCTKCGNIEDISCTYLNEIDKYFKSEISGEILSHELRFNTICENCK